MCTSVETLAAFGFMKFLSENLNQLLFEGVMRKILTCLVLVFLLLPSGLAAAAPPDPPYLPDYVVKQGETLFSIAQRHGTDVDTLARLNNLSDPRQIYAGQHLSLPAMLAGVDLNAWEKHALQLGETFSLLSRRTGLTWDAVAEVNHLLNPDNLLVGQVVMLPNTDDPMTLALAGAGDTWLSLALRHGCSSWELMHLNPEPVYAGKGLLLPGEGVSDFLPYPIASLALTPQPVVQGNAVVFSLQTVAPVTCEIAYLDHVEPCYVQDDTQLYAFVSLSPLLEPGTYPVTLRVSVEGEEPLALDLPVVVTAGRYGYERVDPPAGYEDLADPVLLQSERDKLDALALECRTPERYWELPFAYPVNTSISSYFGSRRSYGGSYNSYHAGVDFRASTGTPVHVTQPGAVMLAEPLAVRGNAVMVDHGWGVLTGYWHLSRIDVQPGQQLAAGDVVGLVGSTGFSTGPHLHWELWVDGKPVDALQWVEPFYDFGDPAVLPVSELDYE